MASAYAHMVLDYYIQRLRRNRERREKQLRRLKTRRDVEAFQEKVRRAVRASFGPLPKRTPLMPKVTGRIERPGFVIEKLVFNSRPGCLVTANLYLPRGVQERAPAVLVPCGHAEEGKGYSLYQELCQRLVSCGFVVLIYDPFDQGERHQYVMVKSDLVGGCTHAHNMEGKQLDLLGEFFGSWRAWDGIRALDYLQSRPEVDPHRIGVTGNSGGGTMTEWLFALDERLAFAAPGCFVSTYLANVENELPQDSEQYPPGILARGLEMVDFLALRAPKPLLLLGQRYDYFDLRGLEKAHHDLLRIYRLLDAAERLEIFVGPRGHGMHRENQEAVAKFFSKWAGVDYQEADVEPLDPKLLWATDSGEVVREGGIPIYEFIARQARRLSKLRRPKDRELLRSRLFRLLGIPEDRPLPHYRVLRPIKIGGSNYGRYAVETEEGIEAILFRRLKHPEQAYLLEADPRCLVAVPHVSSEKEIVEGAPVGERGFLVDPRGMGESLPGGGERELFDPYGLDYMFHGLGLMLSEDYLGRRVFDVLQVIDLLRSAGAAMVDLYGRGLGSLVALFAALLHPSVQRLTLKNCPSSFEEWCLSPIVSWPSSCFPRGILRVADIPEMVSSMGGRVQITDPWGPMMG